MPNQGVTNVANAIINKINNLISSHNSNSNAHQDIRESIPSATSDLNNNSGFITSSSVPNASSATPSADTTNGNVGTGTTWARSDHTHPKSSLYAEASHTHSGKEDKSNKVTSLSSSSTDTEYPSAKAVYDATFNLDTLDCINENFTLLSLPQIILTYNEDSIDGIQARLLTNYDDGAYVDWGDGTPIETYESTDTLEHDYSDNVQEHTIIIYGEINKGILNGASFKDLTGITSINIPSTVKSIQTQCFRGCTGLTSINIPQTVVSMMMNNFTNCINLNTIILNWTELPLISYGTLMIGSPSSISPTFSIPYGTTSLYDSKGYPTEKLVERSE